MKEMRTLNGYEIVDKKAREEKIPLPKDSEGVPQTGTVGQVLESAGDGTTRWANITVTTENITNALGYKPADQEDVSKLSEEIGDLQNVYYIATNHGISTESEDNTPALQTLVNTVSENGGGIIFFPVGTYNFKKAETKYAVLLKSNVSIIGENIENTVFKQTDISPYSMFYRFGTADEPLTGCCFSNFTVDAYATGNSNAVYGKAFYVQYLRDCVFRDLRLKGTIATAMGIDYLDRVTIDNVSCIDCGRTYTGTQAGTSGIGIGTGGWEEENYTITNCVCVGSGQFGIFIENQHALGWGGNVDYSKGCIIANCVVRGGLNHGIGVRGGENVTIIGCETYENAKHGIYLDNKCKNVKIVNCTSVANGMSGLYLAPNTVSKRIVIRGCTLVENTEKGIYVATASDKLCIADNLTDDNERGIYIGELALNDCVIKGNAFLDDVDISAIFEGNTVHNEFANSVVEPTSIVAENLSLGTGGSATVAYTVSPSNANRSVTFESSNNEIATVDSNGTVTGVSEGSCKITITSTLNTSVSTQIDCVVEVIKPTSITASDISIKVGQMKQLNYDVVPSNANRSVTFESSNNEIATVDSNGTVTGIANGSCDITITSAVDDTVYMVVYCEVTEDDVQNNITILNSELTIGTKLDTNGAEVSDATAGVSNYVEVSGSETIKVSLTNFVPNIGGALCEYDSNQNFIRRTAMYAITDGAVHESYRTNIELDSDTRYIRLYLNSVTTAHSDTDCYIVSLSEQVNIFTTDNLIANTKILNDATTAEESGCYASDYIAVPTNATSVIVSGYYGSCRLCTLDSNKTVINVNGTSMDVKALNDITYDLNGVSYIRFCTGTQLRLVTTDIIIFEWLTE